MRTLFEKEERLLERNVSEHNMVKSFDVVACGLKGKQNKPQLQRGVVNPSDVSNGIHLEAS